MKKALAVKTLKAGIDNFWPKFKTSFAAVNIGQMFNLDQSAPLIKVSANQALSNDGGTIKFPPEFEVNVSNIQS